MKYLNLLLFVMCIFCISNAPFHKGILKPDGSESYLGQYPYNALEEILGDEWIEHADNTFINGDKGNELAIQTVRQLRSKKAAEYAFKVFNDHKNTDETKANLAIFAMCDILHPLCMTYVETFLTHKQYTNTGGARVIGSWVVWRNMPKTTTWRAT